MQHKVACLTWIMVLLLSPWDAFGQNKPVQTPAVRTLDVKVDYYYCTQPSQPERIVFTNQDKKKLYPECKQWQQAEAAANLNSNAFSYETGGPRANWFVSDAARKLYGAGLPENHAGHPTIKMEELYRNPQKYGWIPAPDGQPTAGSFAIWPTVGGLVVSDTSQPDSAKNGTIEVLYPSDKAGGVLVRGNAKFISPKTQPKYLIPIPKIAVETQVKPK